MEGGVGKIEECGKRGMAKKSEAESKLEQTISRPHRAGFTSFVLFAGPQFYQGWKFGFTEKGGITCSILRTLD